MLDVENTHAENDKDLSQNERPCIRCNAKVPLTP